MNCTATFPGFEPLVKPFRFAASPHEYKVTTLRECPTPDAMQHCETPDKAADYWRLHIATHPHFNPDCECLAVLLLNTRRRVKGHQLVSIGTMDTILVQPEPAPKVVTFGNHPSQKHTDTVSETVSKSGGGVVKSSRELRTETSCNPNKISYSITTEAAHLVQARQLAPDSAVADGFTCRNSIVLVLVLALEPIRFRATRMRTRTKTAATERPFTRYTTQFIFMKEKKPARSKRDEQAQLLALLRTILPRVAPDPAFAEKIYSAFEAELRAKNRVQSFEKFCERIALPDLEAKTLEEVKQQLVAGFGDVDLDIEPDESGKALTVDVSLPDGTQFHSRIPVRPLAPEGSDEPEVPLKFVSFPVSLPGDPELIWALAKRENLTGEEAGIALNKIEDDFWASKTGQKLLRDRVERSFPEFIARVPAGLLGDSGLKRHYKLPEPVKVLRAAMKKS